MVDHLIWVGLSFALAKAIGFSVPDESYCIKQEPTDFSLAFVSMPQGWPYSTVCNFVASHKLFFIALKVC